MGTSVRNGLIDYSGTGSCYQLSKIQLYFCKEKRKLLNKQRHFNRIILTTGKGPLHTKVEL